MNLRAREQYLNYGFLLLSFFFFFLQRFRWNIKANKMYKRSIANAYSRTK